MKKLGIISLLFLIGAASYIYGGACSKSECAPKKKSSCDYSAKECKSSKEKCKTKCKAKSDSKSEKCKVKEEAKVESKTEES